MDILNKLQELERRQDSQDNSHDVGTHYFVFPTCMQVVINYILLDLFN